MKKQFWKSGQIKEIFKRLHCLLIGTIILPQSLASYHLVNYLPRIGQWAVALLFLLVQLSLPGKWKGQTPGHRYLCYRCRQKIHKSWLPSNNLGQKSKQHPLGTQIWEQKSQPPLLLSGHSGDSLSPTASATGVINCFSLTTLHFFWSCPLLSCKLCILRR